MPKWLTIVLHALVIAGGVAGSLYGGGPYAGAVAGAVNALLPSPFAGAGVRTNGVQPR